MVTFSSCHGLQTHQHRTNPLFKQAHISLTMERIAAGLISSHLSPLSSAVIGTPQMALQQNIATFPCLPLPSGNPQTLFLPIQWCYLPISSSVFLSFLLLSLYIVKRRKVQGVPQPQAAANPWHCVEDKKDKNQSTRAKNTKSHETRKTPGASP